ncbi:YdeI/OmpD-associated family protein [Nocardioides convexus]|uniref:YdeI/OmpD-associated family protein n=1 Tax=Nocardioides convexus TaxID=2712224 RepID=UPI0024189955|nr:YdeI/OmpD-associated family protein [Nocardioides convexus]
MGLLKKHVPERGLTWEQAVPVALCWGWIDSVAQRIDEDATRQRWTPRKRTSNWSKVNLELVEQAAGRRPHAAQRDRHLGGPPPGARALHPRGRWRVSCSPTHTPPRLAADAAATAFWRAATRTYRRICVNWVVTAKQEATRDRRMTQARRVLRRGRA